jgi:hypothetical protein
VSASPVSNTPSLFRNRLRLLGVLPRRYAPREKDNLQHRHSKRETERSAECDCGCECKLASRKTKAEEGREFGRTSRGKDDAGWEEVKKQVTLR